MATIEKSNKVKIHTRYELANGERVPSVTTVLSILNKPALLDWAWRLGTEGIDYKAVRDTAADVGSLAHYLILCHLKGIEPDLSEYSQQVIDHAETCLIKFWDWEKEHTLKPVLIETPLVSEAYHFGGTPDWFGTIDATEEILDFKTGKAIYAEFFYQLAGYNQLLQEASHVSKRARILRIGRDENEGFEERVVAGLAKQWAVFLNCLNIYNLQKEIKKGG